MVQSASERILDLWGEADQIDYDVKGMRGKCLPFMRGFDLEDLPWDAKPGVAVFGDAVVSCVKRSRSRCVLTFQVPGPGGLPVRLYVKRCLARTLRRKSTSWFRKSKGRREWELGWGLLDRGLLTAVPALWADRRRGGILDVSYLVTVGIERAVSFHDLWRGLVDKPERLWWIARLGCFIRLAHSKGFAHDDLSSEHVLVATESDSGQSAETARFYFIDLDQSRLTRRETKPFRRAHNFFQIFRSLPPDSLGDTERKAFYAGYSNGAWAEEHIRAFDQTVAFIGLWKRAQKLFRLKTWLKR